MSRLFFNRWFQLALEGILVTASETLLKVGASQTGIHNSFFEWLGISGLMSLWTWAGIVLIVLSFLSWIYVLRHIPLSIAFPLSNVVHVTIPLSSWIFLGETISARRWLGIAVVLCGLTFVAKPVAQLEERL